MALTLSNTIQIILDGLLLFLCCTQMFREPTILKAKDYFLLPLLVLYCGIARISAVSVGTGELLFSFTRYGYEILPVENLGFLLFLFLIIMLTNSLWFKRENGYTFFGTLGVFAIFIMLREICAILFYVCGISGDMWMLYVGRFLSVGLGLLFLLSSPFEWLKENLKDGNLLIRITVGNTAIILVLFIDFFEFDLSNMLSQLLITAGILGVLIVGDLLLMLWEQRRIQERKRIDMLEQYIPVIEELITQVRARQHEYNNRLLAISAAVGTAENLEQAKEQVNQLIQGVQMSEIDREILSCDSKIIGGMLYSKIKQAEAKKIAVRTELNAQFKKSPVQEADWIEIIGILMDNAIEASDPLDTILIRADMSNGHLSVLVSNPHEAFTNIQFVQMFRRGVTTKENLSYANGHGLANIRKIVERYHGKIIVRNEMIEDKNHVTIGVLL
ncbi:MAG: sensor histidine kinase [Ruminiclostridium sp.]